MKMKDLLSVASNKKMKENTIDTTDRISMLPDFIVHHILSYLLDDAKSRVRMSLLSKRWFTLTASFPILYFHLWAWFRSMSRKYDYEYIVEMFSKYAEHTVSRFCEQNISAHTLDISANIINLEQRELIGRCVDLVLEKGLQVMDIRFAYYPENLPMLRLPNTLVSASSLTSLALHKCELPSSLMVGVVKLQSLRLLSLSHLLIDEGVIQYLTKGCPLLEEIFLRYCYGFKTFCVKRHQNLLKVDIRGDKRLLLERIDVEAPNLNYFRLDSMFMAYKDKAPSMFMASCKKLTTFVYSGLPLKRLSDFLSNFPFLENVSLNLSSPVDNLRLSHHFLRRLELQSDCDLEEIDLNAPNLLLFEYYDETHRHIETMSRKGSSLAIGYLKRSIDKDFDILWFLKLRRFLEKNSIFKVLELAICWKKLIGVEELKLIQSPPYELEHVELINTYYTRESFVYVALVDAVLCCCRPRSLTIRLYHSTDKGVVVEYTYQKLLQQEAEGQTNIKFVLISYNKREQQFRDLNSLLKELSFGQSSCKITFIKEEGVRIG